MTTDIIVRMRRSEVLCDLADGFPPWPGGMFSPNPPFHLINGSDLSEQEIVLLLKVVGGAHRIKKYSILYFSVCSAKHLCIHPSVTFLALYVSCACLPIRVYYLSWLSQSSESHPESWLIEGGGREVTVELSFPTEIYSAHRVKLRNK